MFIFADGERPLFQKRKPCPLQKKIQDLLIIGGLSCIIWTLTLQTTLKYVMLTLKADNRGEGGIFSLYTLVRRQKKWLVFPAMLGGAALLADGMITPPITVTAAIEGLDNIPVLHGIELRTIIIIVLSILAVLFFLQQLSQAWFLKKRVYMCKIVGMK